MVAILGSIPDMMNYCALFGDQLKCCVVSPRHVVSDGNQGANGEFVAWTGLLWRSFQDVVICLSHVSNPVEE